MKNNGTILTTARSEIVRDGRPTGGWVGTPLAIDPRRLQALRDERTLFAVPTRPGDYVVPAWQLAQNGGALPLIPRLLDAARQAGLDDVELHEVLNRKAGLTGRERLVDVLLAGRTEHVLRAIRAAGRDEHGAR